MPVKRICTTCSKVCFAREKPYYCRVCSNKNYWINSKYSDNKEYRREWYLLKKHGISLEQFDLLWQVFSGKCDICKINLTLPKRKQGQCRSSVVIDHDHKTGNIRSLLCNSCNKALGLFNDDPSIVKSALKYLEK